MTRSRRRRRRVLIALLVILALVLLCGREPALVIGTFNIRTFPGAATDPEAVARAIAELDADAFAVQEIVDPTAFDHVLARASVLSGRRYEVALAPARCLQNEMELHVGVVHDALRLDRVEHHFLGSETCPPGQPAGIVARLEDDDDDALVLTSIHFAAGDTPGRRALRAEQWRWIIRALPGLRSRHDAPVIVAGDFNSTGYLHAGDPERELIDGLIADHDLQLPTRSLECSMYWRREQALYDVSLLDHVVAPGSLRVGEPEVLGMCAALACAPQTTAPAGFDSVSDHCPVRVRVEF